MMAELEAEMRTLGTYQDIRLVLEMVQKNCNKRLLGRLLPAQYEQLQLQQQAVDAALTILDALEGN